MRKQFTPLPLLFIFCSFLISQKQINAETLRPVARAVKEKHDLNIGFYSYDLFFNAHELTDGTMKKAISSGTSAEIIPGKLFSLVVQNPEAITVNIPYNGTTVSVDLVKVNLFTDDFSVTTDENTVVSYTAGAYYRGTIKGNTNSVATFSFFDNELYGTISDNVNGNIVVARVVRPGNTTEYVIYSDHNLLVSPANYCNTTYDPSSVSQLPQLTPQSSMINTTKCARLYYEVDHDIYVNNSSNVVNTTNWMTAVHNNVATLYANDNINVGLSQIYVWSTTDPFNGTSSTDQLNLFHTTRPSFNGDLGMLVGNDNNYGGLASDIDGLCSAFNYSYSDVNYTYSAVPTYSWTVEVVAHEYGHLLGSPHTHNCSWPGGAIDDCGPTAGYPTEGGCANGPTPSGGGTIMSYCHLTGVGINFNNGLGPFPAGAIQNAVNSAACLGASCAVCPVPAHNNCATPATLSISANCVYTSGSLCGATQSIAPITCNSRTANNGYDVWYSVTPAQTSLIINCVSGTLTDVVIGLYSGTCGSLTLMNCADATTTSGTETISATVTAGNTYFIRVYDFNGNTTNTDFGICATQNCAAASNNSCATATALTIGASCSYTSGDLCSATQSFNPSSCSGYTANDAFDLFYAITPAQSNIRITCLSGTTTDIVLGLFSGSCAGLSLVKCVDTTGSGGIEIINAGLTIGNTYYIRVYDWNSNNNGTAFQICVQYLCSGPNVPTGATAASPTICAGSSTNLTVTGTLSSGATYHWYSGSCGGTAAGTGATISVSPSITTTYYVRQENGTCYSNCVNVGVAVTPIPTAAVSANPLPATVCAGTSSSISATGSLSSGATWHWYTASCGGTAAGTGTSITVSPSTTTTYYVRAENGSCYSICRTATVSVTALPSNPTAASSLPTSVCSGSPSTLSVTGSLSVGAIWRWYSGTCGGTSVGTGTSVSVSPTSTTTYFVRAENGTCYSSCQSTTVTVTAIPTAATSANHTPAVLCAGSASTISVNGTLSSGATWYWYTGTCGGTSAGTGTSLTVSPTTTTTYFVRAENGTCYSACQSATISVTALPTDPIAISPPASICIEEQAVLQVNGTFPSGGDWYWYSGSCGGTPAGQGASISVSPVVTETYFVRGESGSCYSNCLNTTITVNPSPAQPSILTNGDTLSVPVFATYQWHFSSNNISFTPEGNTQEQKAANEGYYFVVVTDANGCSVSSDTILYQDNFVTEHINGNLLTVYPNPAHDNICVKINSAVSGTVELKIFDDTGKLVFNGALSGDKTNVVSLGSYATGIYQLLFSLDGSLYSQKVLKE